MLLRVGIDKSSDGVLAPIFPDGSFEYIPLSEKDNKSMENRTFHDIMGRNGKLLSVYLPPKIANRRVHFDPEFETFTYGDEGRKATYLLKLKPRDILVFYAGLSPHKGDDYFKGDKYQEALYIIGYFTVLQIMDLKDKPEKTFNTLSETYIHKTYIHSLRKKFPLNSHLKRGHNQDMVLIVGDPDRSKILEKAILISEKKFNKIGRTYHAVSPKMEKLLGIKGSIQRSIPPRYIFDEKKLENLRKLLNL